MSTIVGIFKIFIRYTKQNIKNKNTIQLLLIKLLLIS